MTMRAENDTHVTPDGENAAGDTEKIVAHATLQQRSASDPLTSSWVSAAAGAGKTKVLTDRILRLLLPLEDGRPGTPPEKILALTFTKAGANEMSIRLSRRLSAWTVMDDAALATDMKDRLLGRTPTTEEMTAARRLFARVVDTPGGLRIMTIHSFCQSVLARFPVEAGLAPDFKPLEEARAKELLDLARKNVIVQAGADPLSPEGEALIAVSSLLNEAQFSEILLKCISERHQMEIILEKSFGIDGLYASLCRFFGIEAGISTEDAIARFCSDPGRDEQGLREACSLMANGTKTDQKKAGYIQFFLDETYIDRPSLYADYRKGFLTEKKEIYAALATTGVLKAAPHILDVLSREAQRIKAFEEQLKAILCATTTVHFFRLTSCVLHEYKRLKEREAALDFDDMILNTLSLFKGRTDGLSGLDGAPSWIMYKMDEGIDHILVDEAQDTNPEQWEIIKLLSDDFFNGLGAKDIARTLFVVGDEKQSIFGFQRAAPEKFGHMYQDFSQKIIRSGNKFTPVDIATSFRSVQIVLDVVDRVFTIPGVSQSLTSHYLNHRAKRQGQGGLTELWPVLVDDMASDEETIEDIEEKKSLPSQVNQTDWLIPDRILELKTGSQKLAAKIGDTIKKWLDTDEILTSYGRPIRPGDIMILVKARNRFVHQLVRALKIRNVPVSGLDRMVLSSQLVVQDLCAIARFALLPEDDLTLACLLKSPFIGLSEDALYELSHNRKTSLWENVRVKADPAISAWLEQAIGRASMDKPYEFFSRFLQEPCPGNDSSGIQAIYSRLGEDAMDPMGEFLNLALTYENDGCTSLQDFLAKHADSDIQIKRELDESAGEVRIMTVHAAKGLQAPIVFLPDTVRSQKGGGHGSDSVLWPNKSELDLPFYVPSQDTLPEGLVSAKNIVAEKENDEYRRLLYVAMTRAEERLYICGYAKQLKKSLPSCWYTDIAKGFDTFRDDPRFEEIFEASAAQDGAPVLRLSVRETAPPDKTGSTHTPHTGLSSVKTLTPVAGWLTKRMPDEPYPPRPLVPSRPDDQDIAATSPLQPQDTYRFKRGTLTHRLLQLLPGLPPQQREASARAFLSRPGHDIPDSLKASILEETMALLTDPDFGDIFGEGSMAEVPVTGLVGGKILSGQIDRLLVREHDILIVDFKTNRPSPASVDDVPAAYVRQVNIYADALSRIYPDHTLRAALLWTDNAHLMEIPLAIRDDGP